MINVAPCTKARGDCAEPGDRPVATTTDVTHGRQPGSGSTLRLCVGRAAYSPPQCSKSWHNRLGSGAALVAQPCIIAYRVKLV